MYKPSLLLKSCVTFCLTVSVLSVPLSAQAAKKKGPEPKLIVEGVKGDVKNNIKAHIDYNTEKCELPGWRKKGLVRNTELKTEQALKALGYYEPKIDVKYADTDDCWEMHVNVEHGEPVLIKDVFILIKGEAEEDSGFNDIVKHELLVKGERLVHSNYEGTKSALIELADDRGYLESELTDHRLEVDVHKREATAYLELKSGPRYKIRDVSFKQDTLKQDLADRYITLSSNEYYESNDLINYQQTLSGSGYYRNIRVDTIPDSDDKTIDVKASADSRPRHGYLAGIGYSTDVGPRLRLGYENRRANSRGHRYTAETELSKIRQEYSFNYEIPVGDPKRERVKLGTSYKREHTSTSKSERYRAGIAYVRELKSGWVATPFIDFEREYFTIAGKHDRTTLIMPGFDFSRTRGNHPLYPTRGWRLNSRVRTADENLGSTVSFVQFTGFGKLIQPLLGGRIITRIEGGATLADSVTRLPSSVRFFAGGDHSVRGYGYEKVGPKNDNGDVIGGRHKLTGTIEYDHLFTRSWAWAVFVDGGNAYDKLADFDPVYGYGVGIRWRSPIGPIRFDVAKPSDNNESFRIHVSMGPDL